MPHPRVDLVDLLVQPSYPGAVHLGVVGVVGVTERPGRVAALQVPVMLRV